MAEAITSSTIYKLTILYLLEKAGEPLSTSQISALLLEGEYMDYFSLQTALSELLETNMIDARITPKVTYYTSTEAGKTTLQYLKNHIPASFRQEIDHYVWNHSASLRSENSIVADYQKTESGDYLVNCQIREKDTLIFHMELTVPEEAHARKVCLNWHENYLDCYQALLKKLTT